VISYCEALRVELRRSRVRVTTICPGYIATPMTAQNPYPMPFIIPADAFASRCVAAIDRQASLAVIPWQMAIVGRIYGCCQRPLRPRDGARRPQAAQDRGREPLELLGLALRGAPDEQPPLTLPTPKSSTSANAVSTRIPAKTVLMSKAPSACWMR
jgi:NAD(P)-dependent dehydrogenase (short-subunit alcohol dehydrogenase family)